MGFMLQPPITFTPASGPEHPQSDPSGVGALDGVEVQQYRFSGAGGTAAVGDAVTAQPGQVRRVAIFPQIDMSTDYPDFGSATFTLQLRAADGSVHTPRDQHGHTVGGYPVGVAPAKGAPVDPDGPDLTAGTGHPCWMPDQWNVLDLDLTPVAGQPYTLEIIAPAESQGIGYLQDAGHLTPAAPPSEPVDVVHMARGSRSRQYFSRGNTLPYVCVPHGAIFVTPLTNARDRHWLYQWAPDGGPKLQALAFSHCPSPWIGERGQFQLMPWIGRAVIDPEQRAMSFSHDNERDGVHHYRVQFDNGLVAEVVPTDHAASFRFDFSDAPVTHHGVLFDSQNRGKTTARQLSDGRVSFHVVVQPAVDGSRRYPEPATYYYGETRQRARVVDVSQQRSALWGLLKWNGHRSQVQALELLDGEVLEVVVASSNLSVGQARQNLEFEINNRSFDAVYQAARGTWSELLGRLHLSDDATRDQRETAYSNLARLHCWPNAMHENVGSKDQPTWQYASPFHRAAPRPNNESTTSPISAGKLFVNNGFWDTYRTAWPHFSMFTPELADELLDGTVQEHRDGGWTARWSAPGYVDCMPGASADIVFADAATYGRSFDEVRAYDSALRNATVPPPHHYVGRKGLTTSRFTGFTDTTVPDGMSWGLENSITDDAIARWSASLAERADELGAGRRRSEFLANADYFHQRALSYRDTFDPRIGFFQGRRPDGSWRREPDEFDPLAWGGDYTETCAWGMAVTPWHDGVGLSELYGGDKALGKRLDDMFATQERSTIVTRGVYNENVHEMVEARAIRFGMVAMSNQPAHHVPFMYLHAGLPWRTQWWTREALDRLFIGGEIGQGFPGDEDNGEMSAWWLWAALGLYPLHPGSGRLAITTPLLAEMSFDRGDAGRVTVRADHPEYRFIESLRINGQPWDEVTVPISLMRSGDVLLEFTLSPTPTTWGSASRPISASHPGEKPLRDLTRGAKVLVSVESGTEEAEELVDDAGTRSVEVASQVELQLTDAGRPQLLTLTRDDVAPVGWQLVAVGDDGVETDLGVEARDPHWDNQTMAFQVKWPHDLAPTRTFRLHVNAPIELRQIELLG